MYSQIIYWDTQDAASLSRPGVAAVPRPNVSPFPAGLVPPGSPVSHSDCGNRKRHRAARESPPRLVLETSQERRTSASEPAVIRRWRVKYLLYSTGIWQAKQRPRGYIRGAKHIESNSRHPGQNWILLVWVCPTLFSANYLLSSDFQLGKLFHYTCLDFFRYLLLIFPRPAACILKPV